MSSITDKLREKKLIQPNGVPPGSVQYEVITGSVAYGVSTDTSDMDIYGFCIPPKDVVFPHLRGDIVGFGPPRQSFGQFSQHHIKDGDKIYDLTVFNIVKFFSLCMENNPNMIDSLFVPQRCVLHCTPVGAYLRERRRDFLHRGCWPRFKGYAYSQVSKMKNKALKRLVDLCDEYGLDAATLDTGLVSAEMSRRGAWTNTVPKSAMNAPVPPGFSHLAVEELYALHSTLRECTQEGGKIGKRFEIVRKFGYDVKFGYHVVRLLGEVEQILTESDLDLERNREQLKAIRRGDWTMQEIENYFVSKERELENLFIRCSLPNSGADIESRIKEILLTCLEIHYGSLDTIIVRPSDGDRLLSDLRAIVARYGG